MNGFHGVTVKCFDSGFDDLGRIRSLDFCLKGQRKIVFRSQELEVGG